MTHAGQRGGKSRKTEKGGDILEPPLEMLCRIRQNKSGLVLTAEENGVSKKFTKRGLTAMTRRNRLLHRTGYNCALFVSCHGEAYETEYSIRDG